MTTVSCSPILRQLRRLALTNGAGDVPDEQLLRSYLNSGDEAAFAALVQRHGPMVLGVCHRVLRNRHDAEDAFQATFLVLVRKAHAVARPEQLGNWLYGVAFWTARNARTARARRQAAERRLRTRPQTQECSVENDWHLVLDRTLNGLPDRYRVPLVLCALEGRSRHEVARQLGWSEGTLSSRLARGRVLLRRRLTREGVVLSTAGLTTMLFTQTALAVPVTLLHAAARVGVPAGPGLIPTTVLTLSQGVLHAMFLAKLKLATVWLTLAAILGTGAAVFTQQALAQKPGADQAQTAGQKPKGDAAPSLHGFIQEVNTSKQTITVVTGDKQNKMERTFPLAKDVKVLLREGKDKNQPVTEGKVSDLSAGMAANLQLSADEKTVVAVTPLPMSLTGGVVAVDAGKRQLTIRVKDKTGGSGEKTYQLADNAPVLLNDGLKKGDPDTEGKLDDLAEGVSVQMQISLRDRTKVLAVRVHGGSLRGTVKGLDTGNNTITLTVKEDAQVVDKTLTLIANARVDGDLVVGDTAQVRLSVFDKTKAVAVQKAKTKGEQEE